MSDPVLAAVQKFMDAVEARLTTHKEEIRSMLADIQTRSAFSAITETDLDEMAARVAAKAGPALVAAIPLPKDGRDGRDGVDGKDGAVGERGADGIATVEQMEALMEQRFADLQVRTLADVWRGVFKTGETYTRGQVAQWDGSPWIALSNTSAKPGTTADWQLFAKKGRDASK